MMENTDVLLLIHKAITFYSSVYMDIHDYDVYLNKFDVGLCVDIVLLHTKRHDIAEILLKLALNINQSINQPSYEWHKIILFYDRWH